MVCVDGRGTGGRGTEFGKCTYLKIGQYEPADQVEAAKYMASLPYVDAKNIGIWGWSFGGYNTLMSMSQPEGIFKAGVAVAAPSDWRFYDTVYTERYMRTPKENKEGYDKGSAVVNAANLKGHLLLVHGTADDNVHLRNMIHYIGALNNTNMDKYNVKLEQFCKDNGCYFVNVAETLKNSQGILRQDYCSDSYCHLNYSGIKAWIAYLKTYAAANHK